MADMTLLDALNASLTRTKTYIDTELAKKANSSHTHNYAGSSSAGGAANSVKTNLVIKLNGGSTEGTNLFTFNGSSAKTVNITPSAIGAASAHEHPYMPVQVLTTGDLDTIKTTGYYSLKNTLTNSPTSGHAMLFVDFSVGTPVQIFKHDTTFKLYQRTWDSSSSTWNAWTSVMANDISGNAATATKLQTARTLTIGNTGKTFDGTANVTWTLDEIGAAPTSHASTATTYGVSSASNYGHAMASGTTPKANGTAAVGSETAKFARGDHVHPLQTTVSGSSGSCTGNAATATTWQTSRTLTIGNTGKAVNGSANVSWSLAEIGAIPLTGNTGAYSITGNLEFSDAGTSGGFKGVVGKCGTNDYWRVGGLGMGSNDGRMEIATSDDGNEPIYVRQYSGVYSTLVRTATLLDASGNTYFPGAVAVGDKVQMKYNSDSESLDFIFI